MENIIQQLRSIDSASFQNDEQGRLTMLQTSRELVQRLEHPSEKMFRMVWTEPFLTISLRIATDLNLFAHLGSEPTTSAHLAESTGADALLIQRILRLLCCCGLVDETGVDAYVANAFSASLKDENGLVNGIYHYYDVSILQLDRIPQFFAETGYRNPNDRENTVWGYVAAPEGGESNWWEYLKAHPEKHARFNKLISSRMQTQLTWPKMYPIQERLLSDYDPAKPLVVDVGGGRGGDLLALIKALPAAYKDANLVLEDQPEVISSLSLPPSIQTLAHDFFKPQPATARGAKVYFLDSVLHDWPDAQAQQILNQLKAAMTPGYSKILLAEAVMPERARDVAPLQAALDLNMMAHFSSLERTRDQWKVLVESVGLSIVGIWQLTGHRQGVIELSL